jgi:hypothetical protein
MCEGLSPERQGWRRKVSFELRKGTWSSVQCLGFMVPGSGFGVEGFGSRVEWLGFRVQGSGFRVWGQGVQSSGFRV